MTCSRRLRTTSRSLPSRERGLKFNRCHYCGLDRRSLPSRERGLKYQLMACRAVGGHVAPFAGAWIEIAHPPEYRSRRYVAPFAGAWIEITVALRALMRHPVAPFAGAWIEILLSPGLTPSRKVAPFAGAWIEIIHARVILPRTALSLPSRERGLKYIHHLPSKYAT